MGESEGAMAGLNTISSYFNPRSPIVPSRARDHSEWDVAPVASELDPACGASEMPPGYARAPIPVRLRAGGAF